MGYKEIIQKNGKLVYRRGLVFSQGLKRKLGTQIDKKPYRSFFIILGILFVLIIISNLLGAPKLSGKNEAPLVKQVQTYNVGSAPKMTVQAKIEKSGVVHIVALTPGVVYSVNKVVGQHVQKGETLFSLSSNYQGGNSASLARQLAQTAYQNVLDTYDLQKSIIQKQRDLANTSDENAAQLRDITNQSLDDLQSLTNLNDTILSSLDQNIANLQATNTGGANDALILSTEELKSQFLAANAQAKQASRSGQFMGAGDKPPARLADMQKDLANQQLDLQEKMLDLNREISRIQLQIAQVVEAMMYPSAPFSGTIQRVFVNVGQQVNPGTELAVIAQDPQNDPVVAIAYVSAEVAKKVSKLEPSIIHIGEKSISSYPAFITDEAIQGTLYGVYYSIPDELASQLADKGSILVELPLGYFDSTAMVPYIPIDAVYQTKDQSYVFVVHAGVAQAKSLELGNVYGSYVEVRNGLGDSDRVILDRNVIAGDKISIQ